MDFRKYLAELIGTFLLTLSVSLSLLVGTPLATPIVAGITLGFGVYLFGPISGAHFNPAVTTAMATVGKIDRKEAVLYVIFQIIGAVLAALLARFLTGEYVSLEALESPMIWVAEALGAMVLLFAVSSVVFKNVEKDASGLVIGGGLMLGLFSTAGLSNAVLNPAVAIGLNSISFAYLLAPIVGAVVAAWIYRYVNG